MKKFLAFALLGATALSVSAQTFRPNAVSGAVVGGIAGAVIGNNSGSGNGGKGALIGAAAGAVLGAAADDASRSPGAWRGDSGTNLQVGVGYGYRDGWGRRDYRRHGGSSGYWHVGYRPYTPSYTYGYYSPRYTVWPSSYYGYYGYPSYAYAYPTYSYPTYSYPSYSYDTGYYGSGDSALSGALVGAGIGAIIGNNTGSGNGARGALWGALAGAVLGSTRDAAAYRPYRRIVPARAYATETVAAQPVQQQQQQPQQVTIINNYYGNSSPMSSANSLFGR